MNVGHRRTAAIALLVALVLPACAAGGSSDDVEAARAGDEPTSASTAATTPSPTSAPSPDSEQSPSPEPEPTWEGTPASQGLDPSRIKIPEIGVDADVIDLGLNPDGSLEVPENFAETGWFTRGPRPGEYGAAVIAGHIDSTEGPAVFFRLHELVEGDEIIVASPDGDDVTFRVETVEQFDKDEFPTERVYSFTREPTIRLVTCGGPFNDTIGHYEDNIIAFARRVPPEADSEGSTDA